MRPSISLELEYLTFSCQQVETLADCSAEAAHLLLLIVHNIRNITNKHPYKHLRHVSIESTQPPSSIREFYLKTSQQQCLL